MKKKTDKKKKLKLWFLTSISLIVLIPVISILVIRLEGENPGVEFTEFNPSMGISQNLKLTVYDKKSGLKKVWISILKDGKEIIILEKQFKSTGFGLKSSVFEKKFDIKLNPEELGLTDGKAVLRLAIRDYSWRKWFKGNSTYIEEEVIVDIKSPEVDILNHTMYLNQGGSGVAVYRLSEECQKSGVYVGENFFQGYSGYFNDSDIYLAFFAVAYHQKSDTEIFLKATDKANNSSAIGFPHKIKIKNFKKDIIKISDGFLSWKMPEFANAIDKEKAKNPVAKFLEVNNRLRAANFMQIKEIASKTDNVLYWSGSFLRLPKSATRAGFADQREYRYHGETIDKQTHMGIDLASIARAIVPAANKGKVVFAGLLGIYGKTVVLDHGFNLFSMYSHLSSIAVEKNRIVSKGEFIGRTGKTGLAGGDHLHFGMFVHNTFVNPIEWWDSSWINNNIMSKVNIVKSQYN